MTWAAHGLKVSRFFDPPNRPVPPKTVCSAQALTQTNDLSDSRRVYHPFFSLTTLPRVYTGVVGVQNGGRKPLMSFTGVGDSRRVRPPDLNQDRRVSPCPRAGLSRAATEHPPAGPNYTKSCVRVRVEPGFAAMTHERRDREPHRDRADESLVDDEGVERQPQTHRGVG